MTQDDRLVAIRAGGNNINRRTDQLFQARDVMARIDWQLFQGLGPQGRLTPARHLFIHRLQADIAVGKKAVVIIRIKTF